MLDEGYIKYQVSWGQAPPLPEAMLQELSFWRKKMYDHKLIGFDPQLKVGFGNISIRHPENPDQFIISGTQTGHLSALEAAHYTTVTESDISANFLRCEGPIQASSESLTHAAVYGLDPAWQAVIHVHDRNMWKKLLGKVPTTSAEVAYGTPEMAMEVARLYREGRLPERKLFVMAGHQDGLVAFGRSLKEAGENLLKQI